jgi:hypothetical protein
MTEEPLNGPPAIRPASPSDVTIDAVPRSVKMFHLFESELDSLSSPSASIHLTFFGVTAGAAITLGAALETGSIPAAKIAVFSVGLWVAMLMTAYFLVRGVVDYAKARRVLKEIKKRPTA